MAMMTLMTDSKVRVSEESGSTETKNKTTQENNRAEIENKTIETGIERLDKETEAGQQELEELPPAMEQSMADNNDER